MNPLYAIVLEIVTEPGLGQFIANRNRPYRIPEGEQNRAYNSLRTMRNKVVIADKQTLLNNGFDLLEEDFEELLELPE